MASHSEGAFPNSATADIDKTGFIYQMESGQSSLVSQPASHVRHSKLITCSIECQLPSIIIFNHLKSYSRLRHLN